MSDDLVKTSELIPHIDCSLNDFLALFPLRSDTVVKYGESGNWRQVSRFHQLSDHEIAACLNLDSKVTRGHQFDTTTKLVVLKIAESSQLHNVESLSQLRDELLQSLSITPCHYQIGADWYLYIFLSDFVSSDDVTRLIGYWCRQQGYQIDNDGLTLYPGKGPLPFPLQSGFAWLNENCQLVVRREELATEQAVALFLSDLKTHSHDAQFLLSRLQEVTYPNWLEESHKLDSSSAIQPPINATDFWTNALSSLASNESISSNTEDFDNSSNNSQVKEIRDFDVLLSVMSGQSGQIQTDTSQIDSKSSHSENPNTGHHLHGPSGQSGQMKITVTPPAANMTVVSDADSYFQGDADSLVKERETHQPTAGQSDQLVRSQTRKKRTIVPRGAHKLFEGIQLALPFHSVSFAPEQAIPITEPEPRAPP